MMQLSNGGMQLPNSSQSTSLMQIGIPNDNYPTSVSFPALGGVGTVGDGSTSFNPLNDLENIFPSSSIYKFNAGTRNANTGTTTSTFSSINNNYVQSFSSRFNIEDTQKEMLVFVERSLVTERLRLKIGYEIPSVHALNAYLISLEGRRKYGVEHTCEKLLTDFGFAGSMNSSIPSYVTPSAGFTTSVVMGRRARCTAITRAFNERCSPVTDRLMDSVFLNVIRRRVSENDSWGVNEGHDGEYYWGFYMYVSQSKATPPAWLYIDDISIGTSIKVGHIINFTASNESNPIVTKRARTSLSGKHNIEDKAFLKLCPLLPTVDICLDMT